MDQAFTLRQRQLDDFQDKMVEFRRHIHQNPELSLQEVQTQNFVIQTLTEAGFSEIYRNLAGTGCVAVLRGELDESILLRADMDALPIKEDNGLPFKSQNEGVMHACGHDGHVAMLLACALSMQQRVKEGLKLKRGIKFCFQPGEEGKDGAGKMINDTSHYDLLNSSPKVINCFAFHLSAVYNLGEMAYNVGNVTAASQSFQIDIIGKGGHSMAPEETVDALQIGSMINVAIYQIRGRNVNQQNASAISIGTFNSGSAPNIISDKATITGTIRTYMDEDQKAVHKQIANICKGFELTYGCQISVTINDGIKSTYNSPELIDRVTKQIEKVAKHVQQGSSLAGEDFSEFSLLRPSAFVTVGAALPGSLVDGRSSHPHHSPFFDFDENAMKNGLQLWLLLIEEFQQ